MIKLISLENLQQYHNLLIKQLSEGKLQPINLCPQCNGIMDGMKCPYCGIKYKWVVDD